MNALASEKAKHRVFHGPFSCTIHIHVFSSVCSGQSWFVVVHVESNSSHRVPFLWCMVRHPWTRRGSPGASSLRGALGASTVCFSHPSTRVGKEVEEGKWKRCDWNAPAGRRATILSFAPPGRPKRREDRSSRSTTCFCTETGNCRTNDEVWCDRLI